MKKLSKIRKADIIGFIGIVLSALAQLILSPVIKVYIGILGLGVWHLLFQTFSYLKILDSGLSPSITRGTAAVAATKNSHTAKDFYATSQMCLTIVGIFFCFGGFVAIFLIPSFIAMPTLLMKEFQISIGLLAIWGLLRYRYNLKMLILRGVNRIISFNTLSLIEGAGRPALAAILIAIKPSIISIILGYIIAEIFCRAIASRIVGEIDIKGSFNRPDFFKIIVFGGSATVISISSLIIFCSSSFIIGYFEDVESIAIYQSTIALPYLCARFGFIPFRNKLPKFIGEYCRSNYTYLKKKSTHSHVFILFILFSVLLVVCFLNKLFVMVWVGELLYAGDHFTIIYSTFILITVARHNGYLMWQTTGNLSKILLAHLIEIPLNIALSFIFITHYGLIGIAYAALLAHIPALVVSQIPFFKFKYLTFKILKDRQLKELYN